MAQINTAAINLDINPGLWAQNELVQSLGGPVVAYINLLGYATILTATTGSEYVNGDIRLPTALVRVRHLADHLDTLIAQGLVEQVDGDRWHVDLWQTTDHDKLQATADGREARTSTRAAVKAERDAEVQAEREKADRKREQDRERQRQHRAGKQPPPPPSVDGDSHEITADDEAFMAGLATDHYEVEGSRYGTHVS